MKRQSLFSEKKKEKKKKKKKKKKISSVCRLLNLVREYYSLTVLQPVFQINT